MTAPEGLNTSAGSVRRSESSSVTMLVAATFFMENLDGTIIATAIPQMARSFPGPAIRTMASRYSAPVSPTRRRAAFPPRRTRPCSVSSSDFRAARTIPITPISDRASPIPRSSSIRRWYGGSSSALDARRVLRRRSQDRKILHSSTYSSRFEKYACLKW